MDTGLESSSERIYKQFYKTRQPFIISIRFCVAHCLCVSVAETCNKTPSKYFFCFGFHNKINKWHGDEIFLLLDPNKWAVTVVAHRCWSSCCCEAWCRSHHRRRASAGSTAVSHLYLWKSVRESKSPAVSTGKSDKRHETQDPQQGKSKWWKRKALRSCVRKPTKPR